MRSHMGLGGVSLVGVVEDEDEEEVEVVESEEAPEPARPCKNSPKSGPLSSSSRSLCNRFTTLPLAAPAALAKERRNTSEAMEEEDERMEEDGVPARGIRRTAAAAAANTAVAITFVWTETIEYNGFEREMKLMSTGNGAS